MGASPGLRPAQICDRCGALLLKKNLTWKRIPNLHLLNCLRHCARAASRRRTARAPVPCTPEVREPFIQQHTGLMCRLHLWLRIACSRRRWHLHQPTEATVSGSAPAADSSGDAARGDGHVEVGFGVVNCHHTDEGSLRHEAQGNNDMGHQKVPNRRRCQWR